MNVVNVPFLLFHSKRFMAVAREIPLLYLVAILAMLAGGGMALFVFMETAKGGWIVGGGMVFILLVFHLRRKDYHFVYLVAERPWQVFATGYLLLSLPVAMLEVVRGFLPVAVAVIAGCTLVGVIKQPRRQSKSFPVPRLIPVEAFETRAGFRKYGGLLLTFYLGAYAALLLPYLSFIFLWFCLCFMLDAFNCCEPVALLCSKELAPRQFLQRKLSVNLRFFALSIIPVCLAYVLIRPGEWWLPCTFFILSLLNIPLIILLKYAYYCPGEKITGGQTVLFLSILGVLIPFLAPITFVLLPRYYLRSIRNLTPYLYAYH